MTLDPRNPRGRDDEVDEEDDRPRRASHRIEEEEEPKRQGGGLMALAKIILPALLVFVFVLYQGNSYVLKKDDAKITQGISADIKSLSDSVNALTANVNQINKDVTTTQGNVASLTNNLSNYVTSAKLNDALAAMQGNISSMKSDVQTMKNDLSKAASNEQVNALKDTVNLLSKQLSDDEVAIKTLQTTTTNVTSLMPAITSFSPTSGGTGTSITIVGTNFTNITAVSFGGTLAQSFSTNSSTQITAVVGNGSTGAVSVTNSIGTATYGTFIFSGATTIPQGQVIASVIGSNTMTLVQSGGNVNVSIQNNSGKGIYAEQVSLTLQFLNPPAGIPISNFGLLINNNVGIMPSYSIVPGIVTFVVNETAYITSGTSQTVSISVAALGTTLWNTVQSVNYIATVSVTGYSALP